MILQYPTLPVIFANLKTIFLICQVWMPKHVKLMREIPSNSWKCHFQSSKAHISQTNTSTGGCVIFWVWPPSQQQSISINLTLKTGVTFVEKKTISLQPWSPWFYHLGPPNRSVCPGVDAEVSPQAVQTTPPKNQTAINNLKIRPFGKGKNMHVRYFAIK